MTAIPARWSMTGHMNRVVRHAIAQGLKPITAIQMATLNTAQHFGLERELGSITPGRRADLILTSDLATPADRDGDRARPGVGRGRQARRRHAAPMPIPTRRADTVKLGRKLAAADFDIAAPQGRQAR